MNHRRCSSVPAFLISGIGGVLLLLAVVQHTTEIVDSGGCSVRRWRCCWTAFRHSD